MYSKYNKSYLKKYPKGGTVRKPIVVTDPNDPRLKAYNDSNDAFNKYGATALPFFKGIYSDTKDENKINDIKNNIKKASEHPLAKNRTYYFNKSKNKDRVEVPIFKKPVQPYVLEDKPKEQPKSIVKKKEVPIVNPNTKIYTDKLEFDAANQMYNDSNTLYQQQHLNNANLELARKNNTLYKPNTNNEYYNKYDNALKRLVDSGYGFKQIPDVEHKGEKDYVKPTTIPLYSPVVSKPIVQPTSVQQSTYPSQKQNYQGRKFMEATGLNPGLYTQEQVDIAKTNQMKTGKKAFKYGGRLKRYPYGGSTAEDKLLTERVNKGAGAAGQLIGGLWDNYTQEKTTDALGNVYNTQSIENAVGSNALKGAAYGATFGGLPGAAIGAGVGAIYGGVSNYLEKDKIEKAKEDALKRKDEQSTAGAISLMNSYTASGFKSSGITSTPMYNYGGKLHKYPKGGRFAKTIPNQNISVGTSFRGIAPEIEDIRDIEYSNRSTVDTGLSGSFNLSGKNNKYPGSLFLDTEVGVDNRSTRDAYDIKTQIGRSGYRVGKWYDKPTPYGKIGLTLRKESLPTRGVFANPEFGVGAFTRNEMVGGYASGILEGGVNLRNKNTNFGSIAGGVDVNIPIAGKKIIKSVLEGSHLVDLTASGDSRLSPYIKGNLNLGKNFSLSGKAAYNLSGGTPNYGIKLLKRFGAGGNIYIKPENRGKFTEYASEHGKSVQEMANSILANKENYSSTLVKRANFAKNASKWKHADGGNIGGDDFTYEVWRRSLPENLQDESPAYNLRGYWESLGKPTKFNPFENELQDDGDGKRYYHGYSRNPDTGEILKGITHPTLSHALGERGYPNRKIGAKLYSLDENQYAKGGNVSNPEYEVEDQEVVQGQDTNLEGQQDLASDMTKAIGETHANGGVIGEGGERVFSDRITANANLISFLSANKIKLPKTATYAEVAEKLGKLKGKYEEKLESHNPLAHNTGKAMTSRMDSLIEMTFQGQESDKVIAKDSSTRFADGGTIKSNYDMKTYKSGGKIRKSYIKKYEGGGEFDIVKARKDFPGYSDERIQELAKSRDFSRAYPAQNVIPDNSVNNIPKYNTITYDDSKEGVNLKKSSDTVNKSTLPPDFLSPGHVVNLGVYMSNLANANKQKTNIKRQVAAPSYTRNVNMLPYVKYNIKKEA